MKRTVGVVAMVALAWGGADLCAAGAAQAGRARPDHAEVRYGPDAANVLDAWLTKSDAPAPMLVFIHGGGFSGGDKRAVPTAVLKECLAAGISVASINYRMLPRHRFPTPMYDGARAVQFLRSKAGEWKIDPKRLAASGGSAGAGMSLWLAFHDDLADPNASDAVARQSSRITCAVVFGAQTSYDPRFAKQHGLEGLLKHPSALPLYGLKEFPETYSPELIRMFELVSPIHHLTKDDPPVLLIYGVPDTPEGLARDPVHHPRFGKVLKPQMDALKIECIVQYPDHPDPQCRPGQGAKPVEFLRRQFGMAAPGATGPAGATGATQGRKIVCDGVVGNSGEKGADLVRFAPQAIRGMGVAVDRFGSLWDRAGKGVLNRYAADGRMLGQYRIAAGSGGADQLALAGDTLVLLIGGKLYSLDVTTPSGGEPRPLGIDADHISFGSAGGRIACTSRDGELFLLDVAAGKRQELAKPPLERIDAVEMGPDGAVYVQAGGKMHKLVGGTVQADGWPKGSPGERPQLIDGQWFGHAWHGTIRRFDAELQPAPGVVLGGASGSFIGHLPQNSELVNGRGMAKVADDLYVVSGLEGVMHLLHWRPAERRMDIVRRIGALPRVGGIGLDRQGRIWAVAGSWLWSDRPDSPIRLGVNPPEQPGVAQAVMLDSDAMVASTFLWGQPTFYCGPLDEEVRAERLEKRCDLRRGSVAAAVYRRDRRLVLLTIDPAGKGQAFHIGSDGRFQANAGEVALKTARPIEQFTTLAMKDAQTLLAAGDGQVIELAPDGANWRESRRWGSWGAAAVDKFGRRIYIAADDDRLWVADSDRHRVVCFDLATGAPIATFGQTDKPGTDLPSLDSPQSIAARARRAVLHDAGNQRLVKLAME